MRSAVFNIGSDRPVLTDEQLRACVAAVDTLETAVPGLISLTAVQKRSMTKVGERSADFCRQTLDVMRQNPQLIPANRFSKKRKTKDPMAPVTANGPGPGTV